MYPEPALHAHVCWACMRGRHKHAGCHVHSDALACGLQSSLCLNRHAAQVRVNNKFNPEEEIQALRAAIVERDRTIASLQAELHAARQAAPRTGRKA